jgi:multidrug transporter EmrE-like cation transporter
MSGSDMNTGTITALQTSAVIGTTLYFYCAFNQRITYMQLVGIGLIILSVIIITFGC